MLALAQIKLNRFMPVLRLKLERWSILLCCLLAMAFSHPIQAEDLTQLSAEFERRVSPRLTLPSDAVASYAQQLNSALQSAQKNLYLPQYIVVVDRNPLTQAAMVFFGSEAFGWQLLGATPVSTGLPGQFEHFETPLGVYEHSLLHPDYRAEGTKNSQGFRGYGVKGMRVYDFGWVDAPKTWGNQAMSVMRLQMHATDPVLAEPSLGVRRSKGCVRIPASLNDFIDRYGLLDEDYESALAEGRRLWVLRADRTPSAYPGRYLVIVDSERDKRPVWAPLPQKR